jgi:hypothetical protein
MSVNLIHRKNEKNIRIVNHFTMTSITSQKPMVDICLDPIYTSWIRDLDSARIYRGYGKILDSRNRTWWSDLQIRPRAVFQDSTNGNFFLESSNSLYRVIFQEAAPEMEKNIGSRFLPPLLAPVISPNDLYDIIRGYDSGISGEIIGEILSETTDWFEVDLKMNQKRVGVVKYLK